MDNAPIRIFSPAFELLAEIRDYESLQFTRRFYKAGGFELHINLQARNTDALVDGNIIQLAKNAAKAGIIRHRENDVGEDSYKNDTLIIKGPSLQGLCAQRIVVPDTAGDGYDSASGTQETIMKHFVTAHCVNPTDANRAIPGLAVAADQQRGVLDAWRFRFDNLADALETVGTYAKLGWNVLLDVVNRQFIFDVLQGRNLTASQNVLPPVLFSADFQNIKAPHFIFSKLNAATVGYAGGSGDDADRLIQEVGSASGIDRLEQFFDCSDADTASDLLTEGTQALGDAAPTETFEFQILPDKPFVYGTDYDLGDTVTAYSKKWGITIDAQITELVETYESGGNTLQATFGTNISTFAAWIKKQTRKAVL